MNIELRSEVETRTYRVVWPEGAVADRPFPYSRTGRMYRPTHLDFEVRRDGADPWELRIVLLSGATLKKDGSVGTGVANEYFYSFSSDVPEGLREIVNDTVNTLNAVLAGTKNSED